jgi:hypothetical protein
MLGLHFTGTAGIAFLSRAIRVFTMSTIDNELTQHLRNPLSWFDIYVEPLNRGARCQKKQKTRERDLFWRSHRFGDGTFGWLIDLELFFQLLN